jgi:antitoxin PrlF
MTSYSGTITTTGKSEAIRLEKALFKSHPEFRQKTKVQAHVIGPGTMLISVADDGEPSDAADPVMAAFLSFLAEDITRHPEHIKPLAATRIEEARKLAEGVIVDDSDTIPDDVTL